MSEEHQAFIKTPKQLITVVVLSFVVPVLLIVVLVKYVGASKRTGAGSDAMTAEAIEARIQPVARFELKGAGGPKALAAGADVYKAQCAACHETGAAGAPKFGDAAAWGPRIKTGYDALLNSALKGKGAMTAQGGGNFEDVEIGRAVVHMANAAGAKFEEPKAPAGAAAAAAGTPAGAAPGAAAAPAPAERTGEQVVAQACGNCHQTGENNAPKVGDRAAWSQRVARGLPAMVESALRGHGNMPARGGMANLSDAEVRRGIEYMFNVGVTATK
jgi:cytochrome c5